MAKRRAGFGPPGGGIVSAKAATALVKGPKASQPLRSAPSAAAARAAAPAAAREHAQAAAAAAARALPAGSATAVTAPADELDPPGFRRGSLAVAVAAAATREDMQAAIADLLRDRYSQTTLRSRESWLETWAAMHDAAYATETVKPGPFPLTLEGIIRVAALFKRGGYMSFENYATRAKSEHLSLNLGGPSAWSAELSAAMADAIRSCGRDIGAARQSRPIVPVAVAGWACRTLQWFGGGSEAPVGFVVAGLVSLLRDIELAAARVEHGCLSADRRSADWLPPASKTDPRAVGVSRTWDCTCLTFFQRAPSMRLRVSSPGSRLLPRPWACRPPVCLYFHPVTARR